MRKKPSFVARKGPFSRYTTPQRRRKRKWIILVLGACAAIAAAALLFLLPRRPAPAITPTPTPAPTYQGMDFGATGTSLNATGSSVATPAALTPSSAPTPTPVPSHTPKPTPTPVPVDMDKLVDFYCLDAKQYYNDYGFSSNHYDYSDNELYMLAQLVYGEARGESTKGKIAVANVVMNRVLSRGYPGDTIAEVITAPGQFSGYSSSIKPNSSCMSAARQVLDREVWVIAQNVYFFHTGTEKNWGGHTYFGRIGGHSFYTENYGGRSSTTAIPPALYTRLYKWPQFGAKPDKRISRLQYLLNKLGYKVKADGYYGKTTVDAIAAFQDKKGIHADGIAGPDTLKALIREFGVSKYYARYKYK